MATTDGGWDGPVHGRVGVLADDGERAQCHVCGGWFHNVGSHASQSHGLHAEAYRARFGLNATTALVGPALRAATSRRSAARVGTAGYARFQAARAARAGLTPEQRRGEPWRAEARLDPTRLAAQRANLAKAQAAQRRRREEGWAAAAAERAERIARGLALGRL